MKYGGTTVVLNLPKTNKESEQAAIRGIRDAVLKLLIYPATGETVFKACHPIKQ